MQLEAVGFMDFHFEDMTEIWTQFTVERERQFLADRKKFSGLYGEASYLKMVHGRVCAREDRSLAPPGIGP